MKELIEIGFCVVILLGLIYAVMTWGIPEDYHGDDEEK